ncbi:high affinity copper transporter [Trichophyton tonsurans CBS 112818]|uniref:Copper transport protein n=2 Tax=Trichophyton TaxID=5550 RepID=F2Q0J5_TRIEC|nr:high affinity copper transporter [Trichophyton tonsurans CBS 112818]EGE07663.1 high affinity copper transporter [Trichophyton equinum CBS 127.97]
MDMTMAMTSNMPMPTGAHDMHHGGHGMPAMDHGAHGGMDHANHGMGQCKISMLWNWNVIDACFISSTWRITSRGMFAGSCIGVILLVMSLEFLRRLGREFDKHIAGQPSLFNKLGFGTSAMAAANSHPVGSEFTDDPDSSKPRDANGSPRLEGGRCSPTLLQHTLRSLLHMVQFGVAYFVMLLAMYYNGFFIICILIGAFLGHFVFSWKSKGKSDACEITVCCG